MRSIDCPSGSKMARETSIYVSCLRCQRTIRGLEPYSLWAHIESKGCYPDSVLVGWHKQRRELEKKAEQERAYQATQAEALRKAQKTRDVPPSTLPPPTLGPSIPLPMREAQIVKPRKGEVLETITSFQVKDVPKGEGHSNSVEVPVEDTIWRNG